MSSRRFFGRRGGRPANLTVADAVNVRQGALAQQTGRTFEDELEATNAAYLAAGLATIARAHPPVGGPPNALFYRGKGQVDFVGSVLGIPVAFDAKSNSDAASYKHDPRDYHELDFLLSWRRTGGVSFLLILPPARVGRPARRPDAHPHRPACPARPRRDAGAP